MIGGKWRGYVTRDRVSTVGWPACRPRTCFASRNRDRRPPKRSKGNVPQSSFASSFHFPNGKPSSTRAVLRRHPVAMFFFGLRLLGEEYVSKRAREEVVEQEEEEGIVRLDRYEAQPIGC